ncbi:MAG TPA: OmpA family protein [Cryomorphaceae bacterium]|nr:OmpA family protein [Cryomorphaceae bacterium]
MNNFRTIAIFALALFLQGPLMAQDEEKEEQPEDPNNLVSNPSFEKYEGNLRRDGQFDLTEDWGNASEVISDLFATGIRSKYVNIPENSFGNELPYDGDNYAGIVTYSYRSKLNKSYITIQMKSSMNKGDLYCIKYKASLADRARYATNNLGVILTKGKVNEKTTSTIKRSDVLLSDKNPVVNQTEGWWSFCKRYVSNGSEKYITIGNFSDDRSTKTETREIDKKYAEEGPEMVGYYYIDMVEVRKVEPTEDCGCSNTKIPESKVIYSASVQINDDMNATEKVEAVDAYFYQYKSELVSSAKRSIDLIIEMMKENPLMKVQVIGHMDSEEAELAKSEPSLSKLDENRARAVLAYMLSEGIDRKRIMEKGVGDSQPVSKMSTPISLAKNRRVEFKISL